ncbi:MAG: hypothetical protein AAGD92_07830 [Pseudomonadota bacterium]
MSLDAFSPELRLIPLSAGNGEVVFAAAEAVSARQWSKPMTKSTYLFEVLDAQGHPVKQFTQRCTNLSAQERAKSILEMIPEAAAVIGAEAHGHAVHSAYRD